MLESTDEFSARAQSPTDSDARLPLSAGRRSDLAEPDDVASTDPGPGAS